MLKHLLRPCLACIVLGLLPLAVAAETTDKAFAKSLMQRFLKCWETGDQVTFASLLHPDLVFAYPGGRLGRDALIKTFEDYQKQKKDIKIYFSETFVSNGQKHILPYQFAATDRVTAKRFAVGTGALCELRDGKIIAFREYWDTSVAEQQRAGTLPLDEGSVTPWPSSVWLRVETIN